ncbi:hypothetical protein EW026_g280 [Hermanssonia centrifuga]|uniref:LYR motif-containing protein Cup1-like N-terminal domain-containing protein n=1 Tax=Hermanssonia centrifuga TaxID=98765 RepID=A0A4S4KUZ9_9APHY|nr:hypothetical protein EW026_g280 [Hermanssonia centrifuga]
MRRVQQDSLRLEAALAGDRKAFGHVLDVAYGRKGKLKWEILQPLLSDPQAPVPDRIIPEVERSRPPVYSPELKALLSSSASRTTKALTPLAISQSNLPPRADPQSEEAALLGPFSKRREVNIRWRYFRTERKKVFFPLEVSVEERHGSDLSVEKTDRDSVFSAGIRGVGLQGAGVLAEIRTFASPASKALQSIPKQPNPRRPMDAADAQSSLPRSRLTPRFVQRRYRELLNRLPILKYSYDKLAEGSSHKPGSYSVSKDPNAIGASLPSVRIPDADDDHRAWFDHSDRGTKKSSKAAKPSRIIGE